LRHEILDRPTYLAGGGLLAVHIEHRAPHAARRGAIDLDVLGDGAAINCLAHADAPRFGAIGAIHHTRGLAIRDGAANGIAHQADQAHALTRAVDAAFRIEIRIHIARRAATIDAAIGEIDARPAQIERGEIAAFAVRHHIARARGAIAVH